ncbi:MAG: hypothetical protein NXH97_07715 [Rhodobacteraceae bacterium]|nr:hypothetical protein [Paracoccaceae bacterium]
MSEHKTPWHHGLVAILALVFYGLATLKFFVLWFGFGGVVGLGEETLTLLRSMARWLNWVWALCVFSGLLGAWMLYTRNRLAPLFMFVAFALFCLVGLWVTLFTRPSLLGIYGFQGLYMLIGTGAIAALFWFYARWERSEKMLEH